MRFLNRTSMLVSHIDHVTLYVKNPVATALFYQQVLGMEIEHDKDIVLLFGQQKIKLEHDACPVNAEASQKDSAKRSIDICFVTNKTAQQAMKTIQETGVKIEKGPVKNIGSAGPMTSFYFRDPDRNLIQVASYRKNFPPVSEYMARVMSGFQVPRPQAAFAYGVLGLAAGLGFFAHGALTKNATPNINHPKFL